MGATPPLLIIAETGLPQAERQDRCVCVFIHFCMHACHYSTCMVQYSVEISVLVSLYVSGTCVCVCVPPHSLQYPISGPT